MFHVKSKTIFVPDERSDYFGYAVSLSHLGLHVGAPKAKSRTVRGSFPGLVFSCPVTHLDSGNASCDPLGKNDSYNRRMRIHLPNDFYKDDMWFGAVITVAKDNLLICGPRDVRQFNEKNLLINGVCLIRGRNKEQGIYPLRDNVRQAYRTDGLRKEYGEYGYHLNYFAYGQAGMSATVTKNNDIIIGAPGVLQWTGAVVEYKLKLSPYKEPTMNPYHTLELGPDDYFGYSVESGIFEENGTVLRVAGAPRSSKGYGQVFIFEAPTRETDPLKIKTRFAGPQLGSYFGASLCTVDIDSDGLDDLLVGAPNYANRDGTIKYDQGAVFVYMSRKEDFRFVLRESGHVMGSGESGARFGTTIADLGDVDGDGFKDVAIGAPWENDGAGAVYIYRGNENGLSNQYDQRIYAEGARSFGIALSKGYDVDNNKYNDIAVGAHNSGTVYMYRSIPTLHVVTSIKVPDAKSMKQNATHFSAMFCITVSRSQIVTNAEIEMKASISVDPEGNRAKTLGEEEYTIKVKSGFETCDEQIIEVNNQSDLSKPILLKFDLEPIQNLDNLLNFPTNMARVSKESNLHSSFLIQLLSDCGDDLVCTPWLEMYLESLNSPFIPGANGKLGVKITVLNKEEPAYSVKLRVSLPCPPKRLLESCSLEKLDMICDLPAPLKRNRTAEWEVELEYTWSGTDESLTVKAALEDPTYMRNISDVPKQMVIPIVPKSNYTFSGKSLPNSTISITRDTFKKNADVLFTHYFEVGLCPTGVFEALQKSSRIAARPFLPIPPNTFFFKVTNRGPSEFYHVSAIAYLPEEADITDAIEEVTMEDDKMKFNIESLKAGTTKTYVLPLRFNMDKFGKSFKFIKAALAEFPANSSPYKISRCKFANHEWAGSTGVIPRPHRKPTSTTVTTTLILEPKPPLWPVIVGSVAGLLLLALIILALYKLGFFSRQKKEELKQLIENTSQEEDPASSTSPSSSKHMNSSQELLDSDTE
ncbi:unnamed protein product [Diatraea saccharalis]|uniref:Integrin alpha-2 domain-containing protein n=1 Tax=Diatraea saccharalis TaxID=40085 RepID=A0A9N9QY91_9NEOP|nr:unnamed protein product [Diatraea saccharalis]